VTLQEVQDVGISAHLKDLERAGTLVIKLSTRPVSRPTFARDVDKISGSKVWFTAVLVCLLALMLLGLLKVPSCELNCIMGSLGKLLSFLSC